MKLCGIIAEYNPFHQGHRNHLAQSRALSLCDKSIVIMSGSMVQRGEIAICDKYARAKAAVLNGADAVIELPAVFSTAPAPIFAQNAVRFLTAASIDCLSFGSESGNIPFLQKIAFKKENSEAISLALQTGCCYPKAVSLSYNDQTLSLPNNVLGIEYLRALQLYAPHVSAVTVKRDSAHDDESDPLSAAAIRKQYINIGDSQNSLLPLCAPRDIYQRMGRMLLYQLKCASPQFLQTVFEVEEGLENRIARTAKGAETYTQYLQNVKTKRYTLARLRRISTHVLLSLTKQIIKQHQTTKPYFKVLAVKANANDLLSALSKRGVLLMGSKDEAKLDMQQKELLSFDKKADDFFQSICEQKIASQPIIVQ